MNRVLLGIFWLILCGYSVLFSMDSDSGSVAGGVAGKTDSITSPQSEEGDTGTLPKQSNSADLKNLSDRARRSEQDSRAIASGSQWNPNWLLQQDEATDALKQAKQGVGELKDRKGRHYIKGMRDAGRYKSKHEIDIETAFISRLKKKGIDKETARSVYGYLVAKEKNTSQKK